MNTPDYLFSVVMYLRGDHLDPGSVSKKLGVLPSNSIVKGQRPVSSRPQVEYAPAECGVWELQAESDSPLLSDHITQLASMFKEDHVPFESIEGVEDVEVDVLIAGDTDENARGEVKFELTVEAITALQRLGLPIRFTVSFAKP